MDFEKFDFGVNDVIQVCIWDEFKQLVTDALVNKKNSKDIRFCTFDYITQAMVNIIILSNDQADIIKRVLKSQMIQKLLQLLLSLNPSILILGKNDKNGRRNLRHFIGFIIHTLRFFIVC